MATEDTIDSAASIVLMAAMIALAIIWIRVMINVVTPQRITQLFMSNAMKWKLLKKLIPFGEFLPGD